METENNKTSDKGRGASTLKRWLYARTIKLRAYDPRSGEMGYNPWTGENSNINDYINDSPFIVTWATGIKDMNGEEVYEGDIIKVGNPQEPEYCTTHIVIWGGSDYPAFTINPGLETQENVFSYFQLAAERYESFWIVGNAFENPELLTECT